jgi:hypothetical protein
VAIACALWLADKPFHIDDANFVRFARDVRDHPLRPFASGAVHSNPPGFQYLLAGLAWCFGERERSFHLGLLPLTLLAISSVNRLSIRFGARPAWLPALLCALSPCFLVSASSLMPDVAMLGLVLPALVLLFDDEARPHPLRLLGATLLFAVAWTPRFNGFPVLLLGAGLSLWRRNLRALLPLAALVGAFAFWTWLSSVQLGAPQTLSPLVVAGGSGIHGVLLLKRVLHAASGLVLATALGPLCVLLLPSRGPRRLAEVAGALCFAASVFSPGPLLPLAGLALLVLAWVRLPAALVDAARPLGERLRALVDADDLFLLLWAAAGLAVPVVYNQSAVKYLNLAQPPLLLLLLRARSAGAAQARSGSGPAALPPRRALAVAAGMFALSLALLASDARQATACRDLITEQVAKARAAGGRVFAAGTPWGVLIYGMDAGATYLGGALPAVSPEANLLRPGDQLLDLSWPGQLSIPPEGLQLLEEKTEGDAYPVRLMGAGAGWWSSDWGIAPFTFGGGPYLKTWRVRVVRPVARP